jgi:hypothetical protein
MEERSDELLGGFREVKVRNGLGKEVKGNEESNQHLIGIGDFNSFLTWVRRSGRRHEG